MKKEVFVLAGDSKYLDKIETTLKSILYHHQQVKIYVLNNDIAQEWFRYVGAYVETLGSQLVDVKLFEEALFRNWPTLGHINYMAYARYFIPKYLDDERVLYLDSDLVVEKNLSELFAMDMQGKSLAAVKDIIYYEFNSGVMLIDNVKWGAEKLTESLISLTDNLMETIKNGQNFNGDQTILNHYFKDDWLPLDENYNLQCGQDITASARQWDGFFERTADPNIIHYITGNKPWDLSYPNRFADRWWFYNRLDYVDIFKHYALENYQTLPLLNVVIFTNSQHVQHLETLVSQLPQVRFHIAAHTWMGSMLLELLQYKNVRLYPCIISTHMEKLKANCDLYLDINHGSKHEMLITEFQEKEVPIFAFDNTLGTEKGQRVFSSLNPSDMIAAIREMMEEKNG